MVSIYTLHQLPRSRRKKKIRAKALKGCPQRRGVCVRLAIMPPRKPNSARRKAARVRVSTKKEVFAYIPGIGHNLLKFSHVLLRGGNRPDLPGVHYTMIRGAKDLHGIRERTSARSKYGTKMWRSVKKKTRVAAVATFKKKIIESGEFSYNKYDRQYETYRQNRRLVIFVWRAYLRARRRRYLRKMDYLFNRKSNQTTGKQRHFDVSLPATSVSYPVSHFNFSQSYGSATRNFFRTYKKIINFKTLQKKNRNKRRDFKTLLLSKKKTLLPSTKKKSIFEEYARFYPKMAKGLSPELSIKDIKAQMSRHGFKIFFLRYKSNEESAKAQKFSLLQQFNRYKASRQKNL